MEIEDKVGTDNKLGTDDEIVIEEHKTKLRQLMK